MDGWNASLAQEWLDGCYSYPLIKSLSLMDRCPVNMNILVPKVAVLHMNPWKSGDFHEHGFNDFN
jgi:hypothetical protein